MPGNDEYVGFTPLFNESVLDGSAQRAEYWLNQMAHHPILSLDETDGPPPDPFLVTAADLARREKERLSRGQLIPARNSSLAPLETHPAVAWDKVSDGARRVLVKALVERQKPSATSQEQAHFVANLLVGDFDLRTDQLRHFIHCHERDKRLWNDYSAELARQYDSCSNPDHEGPPYIPRLCTSFISNADLTAALAVINTIPMKLGPLDGIEEELREWQGWSWTWSFIEIPYDAQLMRMYHQQREQRRAGFWAQQQEADSAADVSVSSPSSDTPEGCVSGLVVETAYERGQGVVTRQRDGGEDASATPAASQPSARAPRPKAQQRTQLRVGGVRKNPAPKKSSSGRALQPSQRVRENQSAELEARLEASNVASVVKDPKSAPQSRTQASQDARTEVQPDPPRNIDKNGGAGSSAERPLVVSPGTNGKKKTDSLSVAKLPALPSVSDEENIDKDPAVKLPVIPPKTSDKNRVDQAPAKLPMLPPSGSDRKKVAFNLPGLKPLGISPDISDREHLQRVAASVFTQNAPPRATSVDRNLQPASSGQQLAAIPPNLAPSNLVSPGLVPSSVAVPHPVAAQQTMASAANLELGNKAKVTGEASRGLTIDTAAAQATLGRARSRSRTPTPRHTLDILGFPAKFRLSHIMSTPPPAVEQANYAWAADHAHFANQASRARYALKANHAMNPHSGEVSPPGTQDLTLFKTLMEAHKLEELRCSSAAEVGPVAHGARLAGVADEAVFAEFADVTDFILSESEQVVEDVAANETEQSCEAAATRPEQKTQTANTQVQCQFVVEIPAGGARVVTQAQGEPMDES